MGSASVGPQLKRRRQLFLAPDRKVCIVMRYISTADTATARLTSFIQPTGGYGDGGSHNARSQTRGIVG